MKLTAVDIRQTTFQRSLRGYARDQVDRFLQMLADDVEASLLKQTDLEGQIQDQQQVIAQLKATEASLIKTLSLAQRAIDDMKAMAQKEGELVIRQAQQQAEEITQAAIREAAQIQVEIVQLKKQRVLFVEKMQSLTQSLNGILQWEKEDIGT